jgi:hypothetical protein
VTHPTPPILFSALLLLSACLAVSYTHHNFANLSCTRHASGSKSSAPQALEDNDCTILRTVYQGIFAFDNVHEFLFELADTALEYRDSKNGYDKPLYFGYNGTADAASTEQGLQHGLQRGLRQDALAGMMQFEEFETSLVASANAGSHHDHLYLQRAGALSQEHSIASLQADQVIGTRSRFPCKTAVLLIANDGRVYSYNEYDGSDGLTSAAALVSSISVYLRNARRHPEKKFHLDLVDDSSRFHLLGSVTSLLLCLLIAAKVPASETIAVDANAGTVALVKHGVFRWHRFDERVSSIDNLVRVKVAEVESLKLDKTGSGVKGVTNYTLQLQLAGLGTKSMSGDAPATENPSNNDGFESVLEFGGVFAASGDLKRAAEAINDLVISCGTMNEASKGADLGWAAADSALEIEKSIASGAAKERSNAKAESGFCVVCLTHRANTVTMPCKHLRCCSSCLERLDNCPVCREFISQRILVYV